MTSSPGLRGRSRLQARRGVLQTTTDISDRYLPPPTICVGGQVKINFSRLNRSINCSLTDWLVGWEIDVPFQHKNRL